MSADKRRSPAMNPMLQWTVEAGLVEEFQRWDRLGRGATAWNVPVEPEPFFVPFERHGEFVRRQDLPDEGRREGGILGFLRGMREEARSKEPTIDPFEEAEGGEAPDFLREPPLDLAEAVWTVPDSVPWKPGSFEPFLYSLGAADGTVCFEVVASGGQVRLQWAVDRDDARSLEDALGQLPFPSELGWKDGALAELLVEKQLPCLRSGHLALGRPFVFPLATEHPSDPLADLLARMNGVGDDAIALVQVRFRPCRNPWARSLWNLVTDDDGKPFGGEKALPEAAKEKCRKPLYAVTVRLSVLADGEEDLDRLWRRLLQPFGRFEGDNTFVLADGSGDEFEEELFDLVERRSRTSGMVLNADELLALVHPPASGAGAPGLARLRRRTHPAPQSCTAGFDLALGTCRHGGASVPCGLKTSERLRHVHVVGASGTGKSTFLLNSILGDLEAGHGLAVLDPHGDLVEAVLNRLPESRAGDVVLFDPADADWPVGFNILRAHSDVERNLLASDFVAIFERLSSSWGDQMTAVLGNAAMAFLYSEGGGTLLDLKRFLIEKGFRERHLRTVTDSEVRYFWTREFPLLRGTTQASLLTRLNGFLRHRLVRNMVSQRGERFDVARMMDEGKVVLARLSQGLIGQENSWLLGSLLVSRFHQAALARQTVEESRRRPFFLYLDEAHSFVTPSIAAILSGARKYGLGLVLAHQELGQFPAREDGILDAILANCHTRVCFRLGDKDAKRLEGGFRHFDAEDFQRLGTGEAICRAGSSDADFSLDCEPAPVVEGGSRERSERAVELSRRTYAVPREEVERMDESPSPPPPAKARAPQARDDANEEQLVPDIGCTTSSDSQQVEGAPAEPPKEASPNEASPIPAKKRARKSGRGGIRHTQLQQLVKQHANGLGLRASTEALLPDGSGAVDVLIEGQTLKIAVEIADSSSLAQESWNIDKAFANGIGLVVVISEDPRHLERIRSEAEAQGITADGAVTFIDAGEIGDYFASLGASLAGYETTSRGYRVKVRHVEVSDEERQQRLAAIHRAVARHQAEEAGDDS